MVRITGEKNCPQCGEECTLVELLMSYCYDDCRKCGYKMNRTNINRVILRAGMDNSTGLFKIGIFNTDNDLLYEVKDVEIGDKFNRAALHIFRCMGNKKRLENIQKLWKKENNFFEQTVNCYNKNFVGKLNAIDWSAV